LPLDCLGGSRTLIATAVGAAPFVEEALRWLPETAATKEAISSAVRNKLMPLPRPGGADEVAGRPLVLIADDNADMRNYLARLLNERYNVQSFPMALPIRFWKSWCSRIGSPDTIGRSSLILICTPAGGQRSCTTSRTSPTGRP